MMRNGIFGTSLDLSIRFAREITAACAATDWFPYVVAAIQQNETSALPNAATIVSPDGGHGVMQLTATYPENWADPYANILYAIEHFLKPAEAYWCGHVQGEDLVRAIAAEYNAGRGNAILGHKAGNLDLYTTDHYAARALQAYLRLVHDGAVAP